MIKRLAVSGFIMLFANACTASEQSSAPIIHDAEYYILEAQNGKVWEVEDGQLDKKLAEVLSQAGYATGFFGKLHLGDTEESYPHNQGFDEAFWALYNQATSLYNNIGEGANAIIGMKEELLAENA